MPLKEGLVEIALRVSVLGIKPGLLGTGLFKLSGPATMLGLLDLPLKLGPLGTALAKLGESALTPGLPDLGLTRGLLAAAPKTALLEPAPRAGLPDLALMPATAPGIAKSARMTLGMGCPPDRPMTPEEEDGAAHEG